jgi:poly-beta-1,6-N-acetyl-D-glucosamine synthase
MLMLEYSLVTAARNEEKYLESLIISVLGQTVLPCKWVIISDACTDRTDEIIRHYVSQNSFIRLERINPKQTGVGIGQALALNQGFKQLSTIPEYVGILDADITLAENYYEEILTQLNLRPKVGIAGGLLLEKWGGKMHNERRHALHHVPGGIQVFRRACFEEIGGYRPMKWGGIDVVAVTMARMCGWDVKVFPDIIAYHHRRAGTSGKALLVSCFHNGIRNYLYGNRPLFQIVKCLYRIGESPPIFAALMLMIGYLYASLSGMRIELSDKYLSFYRLEQMLYLKRRFAKLCGYTADGK